MKYMRRAAGYTWADHKTNTQITKELKITPIVDKFLERKRNWIQHVNRMPRNRLPRVMKHYSPTGRRNYGRPLKRILDTWDRNGSTSGPTPWHDYYYYYYYYYYFNNSAYTWFVLYGYSTIRGLLTLKKINRLSGFHEILYILITNLMHALLFIYKILFLYMFRAVNVHLQEDTVVYMQHMVLSFCTRVRVGLSVHSAQLEWELKLCTDRPPWALV